MYIQTIRAHIVLNRLLNFYLESQNRFLFPWPAFDTSGQQLTKFFSCPNLSGTASKRKGIQTRSWIDNLNFEFSKTMNLNFQKI